MISDGKPFDTNVFFSGGAGMFIQYHDVVKPVGLYVLIQMILTRQTYGLPVNIIQNMSILSIIEWYINRRWKNPLQCLDYAHIINPDDMYQLFQEILINDPSIYAYSPTLNIEKMFSVYTRQHMNFPVYIYTETEEPYIKEDIRNVFHGIDVKYVYGDLEECIKKCSQNFTYIFSDIELVKKAAKILIGTCSHILLTEDYRYNFIGYRKEFKYNLSDLMRTHPYIRVGTTKAMDLNKMVRDFTKLRTATS